ncbi:MAG: bifunctional 23S rRNA (guanine(2069)-N(7))-methyltransferase RlmK/23S rRNA (guanine(2445)-N(2))-methyltransferase RlmL [Nannocystis sp.]|nr:bifunctional 23S rRNA (guanine(2069)-N(7))-methyltransferase RlmK/23S rRNA (guanine(2445)-N(2))-methyltransferase RlmL [Nannocystis sp.]
MSLELFATAAAGLEDLLAVELTGLGAAEVRSTRAGVSFVGDLEVAYRACLWSRLASRVLVRIGAASFTDEGGLYAAVRALPWEEHLDVDGSLAVDFVGGDESITHTHFGALRVKDAIVDRFVERCGRRPRVDRERPDLRIHVHLRAGEATISIDLAGESLHRRGYRGPGAAAPLKESLAAAILIRAGWPAVAAARGPLIDPMCGSGTLLIEAAWMAGDRAPGLGRPYFGLLGWLGHDAPLWARLVEEARGRSAAGAALIPPILGFDQDPAAIKAARANIERAGLVGVCVASRSSLSDLSLPPGVEGQGIVVTNPPYGERMGRDVDLPALYRTLGERLRASFVGWQAAVFTGDPELGKTMGLRASRRYSLFNGALPCKLLCFEVSEAMMVRRDEPARPPRSPGGEALVNRLRKNLKALGGWAERAGVACFRVYDSDLPEYAVAIDVYQAVDGVHLQVQEYAPPREIEAARAELHLREALAAASAALAVPRERVVLKVRRKQARYDQYKKQGSLGELHEVREGACRLLVNFTDYLDTGLFLDHRPTRAMIGEMARGRRFLNLFCYTASASVHAGRGGALSTTSVDLSPTYLEWARENLALNGLAPPRHRTIAADCRDFLATERGRYGLIFVDPPTFSNSKRSRDFDLQVEHVALLRGCARLLEDDGALIFSTHNRRFVLDEAALVGLDVVELSGRTVPRDFARNPRIHRCWQIRRRSAG